MQQCMTANFRGKPWFPVDRDRTAIRFGYTEAGLLRLLLQPMLLWSVAQLCMTAPVEFGSASDVVVELSCLQKQKQTQCEYFGWSEASFEPCFLSRRRSGGAFRAREHRPSDGYSHSRLRAVFGGPWICLIEVFVSSNWTDGGQRLQVYYDRWQSYCRPAAFGFPGSLSFARRGRGKLKYSLWGGRFGRSVLRLRRAD